MSRRRAVVAVVVIAGSLTWVAAKGLTGNLVYYRTPTELLEAGSAAVGQRARLGGFVEPGTARPTGDGMRFIVSDGTYRMTVVGTGDVPALFREGQGVVVEGSFGGDGVFHADTVLVKHGSDYRPPAPGETPHTAELEAGA